MTLQDFLLQINISQHDLAVAIGAADSTLSSWLDDQDAASPSRRHIEAIATFLQNQNVEAKVYLPPSWGKRYLSVRPNDSDDYADDPHGPPQAYIEFDGIGGMRIGIERHAEPKS